MPNEHLQLHVFQVQLGLLLWIVRQVHEIHLGLVREGGHEAQHRVLDYVFRKDVYLLIWNANPLFADLVVEPGDCFGVLGEVAAQNIVVVN